MHQDASARLGLPYLLEGQLQKHVTLNEALTRLDVLVQTTVRSRTETAPPAIPRPGSLYIVPGDAEAEAWADFASGALVRFEVGHWLEQERTEGQLAIILDEARQVAWLAGEWTDVGSASADLSEVQGLTRLGLNTSADANNPFAARLNTALWTALETDKGGDGDLRFTLNKQGASDVLSLLFQSDWDGRAELGLIGDDDLRLKVSADGSTWHEAMLVERSTGRVGFTKGVVRRETQSITSDTAWSPPIWAKWVEVRCIAGGGGGGAGRGGASGTDRLGGGGGGAGGMSVAAWPASILGEGLSLFVGDGGLGGAANGLDGDVGGDSEIKIGQQVILKAYGGRGGSAGTASLGRGGGGGAGHEMSNAGGDSVVNANANGGIALTCTTGPGGGGGGGSVDSLDQAYLGGGGGTGGFLMAAVGGGVGSATTGGSGSSITNLDLNWGGGGGGGGGGASSTLGYDGGSGGLYGAGGGGGGGGLTTGGKGGAGGPGVILITAMG